MCWGWQCLIYVGVGVSAENLFKKPQNSFNYSLYYFEVNIYYYAKSGEICNEKNEHFKLSTFSWNNNDIFGCGLVHPPTSKLNEEFPYVFFTQNGKLIGKGVLLKDNFDMYNPVVRLYRCSVEANFGIDLETKPFEYDISKHLNKEFY
ncbi:unnamed protein product [Meloidogyne enterolobii]|uniref:Uncharacterized protein n=1 Tax=Meloidogyne enterolobii TaxID=390850 RepID=A0ACB0YN63_MELEN